MISHGTIPAFYMPASALVLWIMKHPKYRKLIDGFSSRSSKQAVYIQTTTKLTVIWRILACYTKTERLLHLAQGKFLYCRYHSTIT